MEGNLTWNPRWPSIKLTPKTYKWHQCSGHEGWCITPISYWLETTAILSVFITFKSTRPSRDTCAQDWQNPIQNPIHRLACMPTVHACMPKAFLHRHLFTQIKISIHFHASHQIWKKNIKLHFLWFFFLIFLLSAQRLSANVPLPADTVSALSNDATWPPSTPLREA